MLISYTRNMSRIQDTRLFDSVPHVVTRLFREQNRLFGRADEAFGISAEQAHLLVLLWRDGPLSMTELGQKAALSSGTLSAAIDRMETAGLVRREADAVDRRGVRVVAIGLPALRFRPRFFECSDQIRCAEHSR